MSTVLTQHYIQNKIVKNLTPFLLDKSTDQGRFYKKNNQMNKLVFLKMLPRLNSQI